MDGLPLSPSSQGGTPGLCVLWAKVVIPNTLKDNDIIIKEGKEMRKKKRDEGDEELGKERKVRIERSLFPSFLVSIKKEE